MIIIQIVEIIPKSILFKLSKKVCTEKEIWTEWLDYSLHKKAFILFIRIKITLAITHFYNN